MLKYIIDARLQIQLPMSYFFKILQTYSLHNYVNIRCCTYFQPVRRINLESSCRHMCGGHWNYVCTKSHCCNCASNNMHTCFIANNRLPWCTLQTEMSGNFSVLILYLHFTSSILTT